MWYQHCGDDGYVESDSFAPFEVAFVSGLIMSRRDGKEVYYKASDTEQIGLLHEIVEQVMEITCPERKWTFRLRRRRRSFGMCTIT